MTKQPLHESWISRAWEASKYQLSKLGRYKAGGKILGKGKVDAQSLAKVFKIVDKVGNEKIKELNKLIMETLPEFPNNKSQEEFIDMCMEIAKVYDSIVAATEADSNSKEFVPTDVANAIIEDLREYVKEFLDVKLAAVYSTLNEQETDSERLDRKRGEFKTRTQGTKDKIASGDLKSFDSERMKTLKSWKLPLTLMGTGASFGALGWLIKALLSDEQVITIKTLNVASEQVADIQPGEGMTQIMNRALGLSLNPNSSPQEFLEGVKKIGGGSISRGIDMMTQKDGIFPNPSAAKETLEAIAKNPTGYGDTLKDVFKGDWAGTGATPGDTLKTVPGGKLSAMILQWGVKYATIQTAKYTVATKVLSTVGVGLLAGGVAVALARWKGRKSSRAQVLNDLYQSLRPIEPTKENPQIFDEDTTDQIQQNTPNQTQQVPPPAPITNQSSSDIQKDLQALQKYNRNAQIALVLARISENLSLAKLTGASTIENYSDNKLKQYIQQDPQSAAGKVAKLIINIRKNPDGFLTKISKLLNVELEKRARAVATKVDKNTKASLNPLAEHSVLLEALVDDVFNEFGITAQILKQNRIQILALLGAMYAKEGDTSLSIVDPKKLKLTSSEKKLLQSSGFTAQAGGNYVFLGPSTKKSDVMSKKQLQEIIKEEVARYIKSKKLS